MTFSSIVSGEAIYLKIIRKMLAIAVEILIGLKLASFNNVRELMD